MRLLASSVLISRSLTNAFFDIAHLDFAKLTTATLGRHFGFAEGFRCFPDAYLKLSESHPLSSKLPRTVGTHEKSTLENAVAAFLNSAGRIAHQFVDYPESVAFGPTGSAFEGTSARWSKAEADQIFDWPLALMGIDRPVPWKILEEKIDPCGHPNANDNLKPFFPNGIAKQTVPFKESPVRLHLSPRGSDHKGQQAMAL